MLSITLCYQELRRSHIGHLEKDTDSHRAGELAGLVWWLANFFCTEPDSNYFRPVDISDSADATQFYSCSMAAIEICK